MTGTETAPGATDSTMMGTGTGMTTDTMGTATNPMPADSSSGTMGTTGATTTTTRMAGERG
ncbi:hypothetical protein [Altericroceibacterium xinjiangense]|uniref:hypothetical protein n=1 Tax=Altericroceibacterium xinjiangense TaxID=762261 RepID=UPI000F7E8027|nr:hypothetical protein [Altericroceibacterium xinjiangense]